MTATSTPLSDARLAEIETTVAQLQRLASALDKIAGGIGEEAGTARTCRNAIEIIEALAARSVPEGWGQHGSVSRETAIAEVASVLHDNIDIASIKARKVAIDILNALAASPALASPQHAGTAEGVTSDAPNGLNVQQQAVWDAIAARIEEAPKSGIGATGEFSGALQKQQFSYISGLTAARLPAIVALATQPVAVAEGELPPEPAYWEWDELDSGEWDAKWRHRIETYKPTVYCGEPINVRPLYRASSIQAGVEVKPLEWLPIEFGGWKAESDLAGYYNVYEVDDGHIWTRNGTTDLDRAHYGTEAKAKAAAQADYSERILSALAGRTK